MVAIDSAQDIPALRRSEAAHTGWVVLFAVLGSALLTSASLVLNAESGTGWPVAAQMVSRFSLLLFVAAMLVEPLARLLPFKAMQALGRERGNLTLGFAAASAVGLAAVAAPFELGQSSLSAPFIAYCVMTAFIVAVLLLSAHPATIRYLGAPAWRAMQRVATSYFWIVFMITGIEHLVGPHRPDGWYGFSLLLLIGAVLIRFVDSFVAHWRYRPMAEKVA